MPINNYDDFLSQISSQNAGTFQYNNTLTSPPTSGRLVLMPRFFSIVPSTPSSSIALDNNSLYAINQSNLFGTDNSFLLGGQVESTGSHTLIVVDLLNISGGLSANLTTEQTTGLPTAPLTRYSSGEGVFAGLIIWTALGATVTTVSINYTNQNGTERVSPFVSFSSAFTSDRNTSRIFLIPLASGDTGVRSVKSVTLSTSTSVAGDFGVILFKPLSMIVLNSGIGAFDAVSSGGFVGSLSTIFSSACLSGILSPGAGSQIVSGSLFLGK